MVSIAELEATVVRMAPVVAAAERLADARRSKAFEARFLLASRVDELTAAVARYRELSEGLSWRQADPSGSL